MVRRSTGRFEPHPLETDLEQVELLDDIDHPDPVVLGDVLVQPLRKQCGLGAILTLDVSLHGHLFDHMDDGDQDRLSVPDTK
jgi:hypothetical protein